MTSPPEGPDRTFVTGDANGTCGDSNLQSPVSRPTDASEMALTASDRLRGPMISTVGSNILVIAVSLGASVIVARELGASGRGTFATLFAVFGLALVLSDIGQSSSVTFFTARDPSNRAGWVADGRRIMMVGGIVVTAVGVTLVGPFGLNAGISSVDLGLAISACLVNGVAAPSVFALQAISIRAWNAIRLIQPCVYTILVGSSFFLTELTIRLLAILLVASVTISLLAALIVGRRFGLANGVSDRARSAKMLRYGVAAYASGLPVAIVQNGDRLVIIALLDSSDVGHYAVAVSVMTLTGPVAIAISSIQFPRLAGLGANVDSTRTMVLHTLRVSAAIIVPISVAVAGIGQWLVPAVFGPDFEAARWLLWALVPVGILRSILIVTSGLLRGLGRPGVPALAQTVSMVVVAVCAVPACLVGGLAGLVAAITLAELTAFALCLPVLRRPPTMA